MNMFLSSKLLLLLLLLIPFGSIIVESADFVVIIVLLFSSAIFCSLVAKLNDVSLNLANIVLFKDVFRFNSTLLFKSAKSNEAFFSFKIVLGLVFVFFKLLCLSVSSIGLTIRSFFLKQNKLRIERQSMYLLVLYMQ